jgi:uncharacterized membrane protein YfcA
MLILLVSAAAFVAAMINAAAGGGTFITFPILTGIARLTEKAANITSTLGLWPGTISSVAAARQELRKIQTSVVIGYAIMGFIGGLAGAILLLTTPVAAFRLAVPWLLLFATIVFALGKRLSRWAGRDQSPGEPRFSARVIPLLFIISLYNGYFGAGAGVLLLAGLSLAGLHDLKQMNALKVIIQTTANASAVAVFAIGAIYQPSTMNWPLAGAMAIASAIGGFVGMAVAQRVPQTYVRAAVLLIGTTLSIAYFYKAYFHH